MVEGASKREELQRKIESINSSIESLEVSYNGWLKHEDGPKKDSELKIISDMINSKINVREDFISQLKQTEL